MRSLAPPASHPPVQRLSGSAVLAFLWAALAAPIVLGFTLWHRDLLIYSYPQKLAVIDHLREGTLPLWSESWGTGRPIFSLVQPGTFDPFNVLLLLPMPLGVDLYNLSHLAVVMFGTRAWLRAERCPEADAVAGGALLGMSGYLASMLSSNGTYGWGVAMVPWVLAFVRDALVARDRPELARATAHLSLATALGVLSGDPMSGLFAGLAGLALCLQAPDRAARWRGLAALGVGSALAGLVCAAQLLPALEAARTYRGNGVSVRDAATFSLHPLRLLELVAPDALGEPYGLDWAVPSLYPRSGSSSMQPFAFTLYQGVAVVPLAVLAARRGGRLERVLAGLALAAAVLAAGRYTPVWPWCFEHVPGLKVFRHPEKYWFLVSLALAALAARGMAHARKHAARSTAFAAAGAVALVAAALTLPGLFHHHALPSPRSALLRAACIAAGYAFAFGLAARATSLPTLRLLPSLLLVLDATLATAPLYQWTPAQSLYRVAPFVGVIARNRGGDARGVRMYRNLAMPITGDPDAPAAAVATMMPNVGIREGVGHLDSYDAFAATRVRGLRGEVERSPVALLRWWGIEYVVQTLERPLHPELREVARDTSWRVRLARVPGVAPRSYLARATVDVRTPEEALAVARSEGFVPGETATVEGAPRSARGRCVQLEADAHERRFACESDADAWLVVGETYDPVWKATVNGRPARVTRGNELYMAVPVPAGRATVRLRVEPWGLGAGMWASLVGLGLVAALRVYGRPRRDAR